MLVQGNSSTRSRRRAWRRVQKHGSGGRSALSGVWSRLLPQTLVTGRRRHDRWFLSLGLIAPAQALTAAPAFGSTIFVAPRVSNSVSVTRPGVRANVARGKLVTAYALLIRCVCLPCK